MILICSFWNFLLGFLFKYLLITLFYPKIMSNLFTSPLTNNWLFSIPELVFRKRKDANRRNRKYESREVGASKLAVFHQ